MSITLETNIYTALSTCILSKIVLEANNNKKKNIISYDTIELLYSIFIKDKIIFMIKNKEL